MSERMSCGGDAAALVSAVVSTEDDVVRGKWWVMNERSEVEQVDGREKKVSARLSRKARHCPAGWRS